MSRELFNFIWVAGRKANAIHVGPGTDRVDAVAHPTRDAVILYPTLFTPAVYVQGRATAVVELLIASKQPLTERDVNVHLKISPGLDPEKAYDPRPLFVDPTGLITVEKTAADGNGILHTHRRFSGILAAEVKELYAPYANLYKVSIADSAIRRERPPVMEKLSLRATVGDLADAIVSQAPDDVSVAEFLENAGATGGDPGRVPGRRRYGFKVGDNGQVDLSKANPEEPVQTYHPLFVWSSDLAVANFGHVSDVHVNARLNILRRSPAQVVEDPKDGSPPVGTRLVDTNDSFASVLSQMRQDPSVHALAVGGDLIDHIRNTYDGALFDPAAPATIGAIWSAVDLGDAGLHDRYPAGIDYLLFYSMIVDFIRRSSKPVFGISGNHDAYEEPFGISPRVGSVRANGGIPSDLNLTFYEALLCFGPTWPAVVKKGNFNSDWWVWFYRVFGAFNDFVVRLPSQGVVGLGWGSQEDLIDVPPDGQGYGHLPRSDDAVTDAQLALLRTTMPARIVLFTHFTVLSYNDPVPMFDPAGRRTQGTLSEKFNNFNMGTFESNREAMLDILSQPSMALVVCGHSHRRGTYQITGSPEPKVFSVEMHDTKTVGGAVGAFRAPVIAVSDSAGPMPRLNLRDEFGPFGSDVSGGTLATFGPDARLVSMGAVQAQRARPRVCVSLDYLDLPDDADDPSLVIAAPIATGWFTPAKEAEARASSAPVPFYTIEVPFQAALFTRISASVSSFVLHGAVEAAGGKGLEWMRIELSPADATGRRWSVPADKTRAYYVWATAALETFVAFTFKSSDAFLSAHYDWADSWYFEVKPKPETTRTGKRYLMQRPSREATGSAIYDAEFKEIPDFDWRRQHLKDKYGP